MMVKFKLGRNKRKMLFNMDEVSTSLLQLSGRASDQCAEGHRFDSFWENSGIFSE